jgi:hypothetical protein
MIDTAADQIISNSSRRLRYFRVSRKPNGPRCDGGPTASSNRAGSGRPSPSNRAARALRTDACQLYFLQLSGIDRLMDS